MKVLQKYLNLYKAMFKASLVADMQFRVNFIVRIVTDVFWYVAQILTFEVLYLHTKIIGHWKVEQTRVFIGVLFVIDALYMIAFHDNLDRLNEKVRKGNLDLLLTKPTNSQFMISCERVSTALIGNFIIGLSWFLWSLSRLPDFNWLRLFWLLLLIPSSLMILYSVRFIFSAVSLLSEGSSNFQFVWYQVYRLGMRPDSIYFPWMKWILMTILPVSIIVSVPARALLDPIEPWLIMWTLFLAPTTIYCSHLFWKICLKRYSSASS